MLKIPGYEDPTDQQLQNLLTLYNGGAIDEALVAAQQLLEDFPDSAVVYNIQGAINARLEQFDLAIQSYLKALKIKPDYAQAYNNIGVSLRTTGQLEPAIESYKQALIMRPDYSQAFNNLGIALQDKGDFKGAEHSFQNAIGIDPNYAEAYYNLGLVFQNKDELEIAKVNYLKALEIEPNYAEAHYNLGIIFQTMGEIPNAIICYKNTLVNKPDFGEAKHLIDSLSGNTTNAPPKGYVEKLFNTYAKNFEQSLVDQLKYQTPQILAKMIRDKFNDPLGSVLDLGCGTGLMGKELSQNCDYLEGIDLSNCMLEEAKKKNVYNKLRQYDIVEYLTTEPLNFNYLIAADVFVYVGELSDIFRLIKCHSHRTGRLVFSTEHTEKAGYFLEKSGRYSHSKSYIEGLCSAFNYRICHFSISNLRKENDKIISGGLYLLEF